MTIEKTTLHFLREDCQQTFGPEMGEEIFCQTEDRFQQLLAEADDRGNQAIREHLEGNLLPVLAFYLTLLDRGMEKEAALSQVRRQTQRSAREKREEMANLARLPFAYGLYRAVVKKYMAKHFPPEGWDTRWIRRDSKEIHFDLHTCLYWEVTQAYGCPELCCVYCEKDDIGFSGLAPKIRFQRAGTLGQGAACCDFHFIKG